ncbi:chemotaxis protein CheW [Aerolutibacter ruishenii]|uniref:Chemosensory pili system protein ChpC n=1 Tax=Aerolutibacter ruishenii TaxID=686800 RepID=A0A562M2E2_9GAMM|nr:chemotaxis protein CheW [Lysobacter ruishenii]TWI14089.1 chemosensory pili system protein ChpC [Lysobacter ruishenii]
MSQAQTSQQDDIRGVLIQTAGGRLLLPNATIAEVLSYAQPDPVEGAPDWLLGRIRWRGWQLPLVAFADMAGVARENAELGAKMVVLKAMGGNPRAPYFALLTQGFPRLVTVSPAALGVDPDQDGLPAGARARVLLNDEPALLPDLEGIEHLINQALAAAA